MKVTREKLALNPKINFVSCGNSLVYKI